MKHWIIAALALSVLLCMAACDQAPETPETTDSTVTEALTEEATTEAPETEAPTEEATTEAPTEEATTEEETTEAKEETYHPTLEEVGQYATTILETEDILKAAHNEQLVLFHKRLHLFRKGPYLFKKGLQGCKQVFLGSRFSNRLCSDGLVSEGLFANRSCSSFHHCATGCAELCLIGVFSTAFRA